MGYPPGRIGVRDFSRRTGISRSTFYANYRWDEGWIRRLDIRMSRSGHITLCEDAVNDLARECVGDPATGASPIAGPLSDSN